MIYDISIAKCLSLKSNMAVIHLALCQILKIFLVDVHVDKLENPYVSHILPIINQHVNVPIYVAGHTLNLVITKEDCDLLPFCPLVNLTDFAVHHSLFFKLTRA